MSSVALRMRTPRRATNDMKAMLVQVQPLALPPAHVHPFERQNVRTDAGRERSDRWIVRAKVSARAAGKWAQSPRKTSRSVRLAGPQGETMKQLSGLDASFLYLETPEMPMHVGALHLFELPAGYKGKFVRDLRRHVA